MVLTATAQHPIQQRRHNSSRQIAKMPDIAAAITRATSRLAIHQMQGFSAAQTRLTSPAFGWGPRGGPWRLASPPVGVGWG
jgi:hypothetical protein